LSDKIKFRDVPEEWRQVVKNISETYDVDVDTVVRYGIHYDFSKFKERQQ
jgi:hypothetical protein